MNVPQPAWMPPPLRRPLLIRLCNWVGEAVLCLPALNLLTEQGYELHLVGKRWAVNLFEGHGWVTHVRPAKRTEAITQLRRLSQELAQIDPSFSGRPNILLFTSSFSSALEARLAGLKPIGYNLDGRRFLLSHGIPYQPDLHAGDSYWRIASHFVGTTVRRPPELGLRPSTQHLSKAAHCKTTHKLGPDFIILCPFSGAGDTTGKKRWPDFPQLAQVLHARGHQIVLCPGPDEEAEAQSNYPDAIVLTGVDLGTYAALSQQALCTVSNDTGPGHLAAAAGGRVVSVLGPDGAAMWYLQGEHVIILHPKQGWPNLNDVLTAIDAQTHQ